MVPFVAGVDDGYDNLTMFPTEFRERICQGIIKTDVRTGRIYEDENVPV